MSKNLVEHGRTQKGNSCIEGSKLDRGYAGRASTVQDESGTVIRNKARLVAQGYIQEEGIDYDEVFAPVERIEAIRLFLAYASFEDFVVNQMDVKNTFLYGKIKEEVYVCQPPGFEDPNFPDRVYKVEKALYGLHQAPRAWYETLSTYLFDNEKKELCIAFKKLMHEKFQISSMGELTLFLGLQVQQKKDGIFISQDKYVAEILKKFGFTEVKTASTPMETQKPLLKDEYGEEVDAHMYRSMIGSMMYLTSSRPDIMFAACACARYQVNPKVSHLHAVKRIFRNLKGQPKLGLWYPKDSPFNLVAYTDSDYARASLDRKSTTRGCQFLGCRLISWQCKKQTVVVISKTKAEYVVSSSCCGQVLWIQNQLLDYGYNFMHTKIFIDNNKDAEGVDCLPNATIFEQLALMGSKTTTWNEISSTMASAIICLATNKKFNFSKYIFESMVKNLDNVGKFLMYPRFIQVFLDKQLEGMLTHKRIYIAPSHTKKIFRNMKRVGKGFSGRITPLFLTMVVQNHAEMGEGSTMPTDPYHRLTIIQPSPQPQKKQKPRKPKRKNTQIPQSSGPTEHVADETVHNSLGTTSGGGPRCQETLGDTLAQTRFENVSKLSNDPLLARGNTLQSGEDRLKLKELMELCTNLQQRVLDLEKTKTTQAEEIITRVESSRDEESLGEDASKQGRINAIDADEDITLVNDQDDADMFDVNTLTGDEVLAEPEVAVKDVNLTVDEVTLAQALAALKSVKPKVKANVVEEPSVPVSAASTKVSAATTTTTATIPTPRKGIVITELGTSTTTTTISSQPSQAKVQDKGKGILVEEPVKPKKKDLIRLDEEIASKLQAEFDEEERLAREKDEANVALTEEWDDIQAKIEADHELAQKLQAEEQEQFTTKKKPHCLKNS
ncbi:putative ribonuclease H-like domain-containing protein [Tanacetum coccineum]